MKVPGWIEEVNLRYRNYNEIPQNVFDTINENLDSLQSETPTISIVIAAYNEEVNVLRCLLSLSKMQTQFPLEFVVVNNNSGDQTQKTLDRLHVRSFFQPVQGCGPARQMAQENARGKYILLADADCLYPAKWVDEMMNILQQPGVVCVYGRYSFLPEPGFSRWQLYILERLKDVIASYRQIRKPYFNTYGISMGYVRDYGMRVGYITENVRGEDGRLAMDMMKYGKIKPVKSNTARAWTGPRTLAQDGSFAKALSNRVIKEFKRSLKMFKPDKQDDIKRSVGGV